MKAFEYLEKKGIKTINEEKYISNLISDVRQKICNINKKKTTPIKVEEIKRKDPEKRKTILNIETCRSTELLLSDDANSPASTINLD